MFLKHNTQEPMHKSYILFFICLYGSMFFKHNTDSWKSSRITLWITLWLQIVHLKKGEKTSIIITTTAAIIINSNNFQSDKKGIEEKPKRNPTRSKVYSASCFPHWSHQLSLRSRKERHIILPSLLPCKKYWEAYCYWMQCTVIMTGGHW